MATGNTFYKARRTVIFEGVPGAGKSTATVSLAKLLAATHDDWVVLLNHKPLDHNEPEVVFDENGCNREGDFIEAVYSPAVKSNAVWRVWTIGLKLIEAELKFIDEYPVDPVKGEKIVVNVIERNSVSAASMFLPGNHFNSMLAFDVNPQLVRGRVEKDWDNVSSFQTHMLELIKSCVLKDDLSVVVMLDGNPELSLAKVVKRGRPYEAQYLSQQYMNALTDYHKAFIGHEDASYEAKKKVVPWNEIYDTNKTILMYYNVDDLYEKDDEIKMIKNTNQLVVEVADRVASYFAAHDA